MEDLLGGGVRGGDCARCWWLLFGSCWYSSGFSFPVMIFVHCRGSQVYFTQVSRSPSFATVFSSVS